MATKNWRKSIILHPFQEFTFPDGVAYLVGGPGREEQQYALMEMHYDNPDMVEGNF